MQKKVITINLAILWVFAVAGIILLVTGIWVGTSTRDLFLYVMIAGNALFIAPWIIILSELLKRNIHNKIFWVMSMFILPFLTVIVYLFRRQKIIISDNE